MPGALFIGGMADGEWIDVPNGERRHEVVQLVDPCPLSYSSTGELPEPNSEIRRQVYKLDQLIYRGRPWRVFVPLNYATEEWIEMLFNSYGKRRKTPADARPSDAKLL